MIQLFYTIKGRVINITTVTTLNPIRIVSFKLLQAIISLRVVDYFLNINAFYCILVA